MTATLDTTLRPTESLTFAVRAIARLAGVEINHATLNEALGFQAAAGGGDPDSMFHRDRLLLVAGKRFGLQIRPVHPPDAACGLEDAPEFEQHFEASYRPLIHRALENGQHVLAWRGWEGERELSWGWIRAACEEGIGFRGATIWSDRELASLRDDLLVRPAVQLHVVERLGSN